MFAEGAFEFQEFLDAAVEMVLGRGWEPVQGRMGKGAFSVVPIIVGKMGTSLALLCPSCGSYGPHPPSPDGFLFIPCVAWRCLIILRIEMIEQYRILSRLIQPRNKLIRQIDGFGIRAVAEPASGLFAQGGAGTVHGLSGAGNGEHHRIAAIFSIPGVRHQATSDPPSFVSGEDGVEQYLAPLGEVLLELLCPHPIPSAGESDIFLQIPAKLFQLLLLKR